MAVISGLPRTAGGTIEPAPPPEATVSAATDLALRELTEGLSSRPTVAGVIARNVQMTADSDKIGAVPVRTRGVSTHRDDFLMPACAERGLVRTAMFHAPADVPRAGRLR